MALPWADKLGPFGAIEEASWMPAVWGLGFAVCGLRGCWSRVVGLMAFVAINWLLDICDLRSGLSGFLC